MPRDRETAGGQQAIHQRLVAGDRQGHRVVERREIVAHPQQQVAMADVEQSVAELLDRRPHAGGRVGPRGAVEARSLRGDGTTGVRTPHEPSPYLVVERQRPDDPARDSCRRHPGVTA